MFILQKVDVKQHMDGGRSFSKGLLVVILLVSLFSFSGSSFCPPPQKNVLKTEQVVSVNKSAKGTPSFRKASLSSREEKISSLLTTQQITVAALAYKKVSAVKIKVSSRKKLSIVRSAEHCASASIPHSYDEDHFNSFRG